VSKGGSAGITGSQRYQTAVIETGYKVEGGWCDAVAVTEGDISECLKAVNQHGQIGDCTCCTHYWPDDPGVQLSFFDEEDGKRQVDADCQYLMRMIELVRRGIGKTEDISSALHRLQHSSSHYGSCILKKYGKADNM